MSVLEVILMSIGISVILFVGYLFIFNWALRYAERTPLSRVRQAKHDIDAVLGKADADMDDLFERPRARRRQVRDDFRLKASEWSS